jgi:hypothetical protein
MYFAEPLTDFRTHLYTDDGQTIEVDFNVNASAWQLTAGKNMSRETLREIVAYLHDQFYRGEEGFLRDWLSVVEGANLDDRIVLKLKTVDRL